LIRAAMKPKTKAKTPTDTKLDKASSHELTIQRYMKFNS